MENLNFDKATNNLVNHEVDNNVILNVPKRLQPGDNIRIISPSSGVLGEDFVSHEIEIGKNNLESFHLQVSFGSNSLLGKDYLGAHPEARAADIKEAFLDDSVDAIISAIGGDDTFRTVPFLLDDEEFIQAVQNHPKIFTGYSDATINHLMFYKLGLRTFYGPCFLTDFAELSKDMLPYTKQSFATLFNPTPNLIIDSSSTWYEERTDFSPSAIGTDRLAHPEAKGYETLYGTGRVTGELLGGCVDSLYELISGDRYKEQKLINEKYHLFPSNDQWKGKIFFFETSEEKPSPDRLAHMLQTLEQTGMFQNISGILIGKPQNETYYNEYRELYSKLASFYQIPTIYNLNFGHSYPRTILPYGAKVDIDFSNQNISLLEEIVK